MLIRAGMPSVPKGNYVPPRDRPKWQAGETEISDLLYLGWGRRYHGKNPPPPLRHPGWLYIHLVSGSPTYLINGKAHPVRPGAFILVHPECAFGVTDRESASCTWLLWIWKSAPVVELAVPEDGHLFLQPSAAEAVAIKRTHEACRSEVAKFDALTDQALSLHHQMLDVQLARCSVGERSRADETSLVRMAVRWLEINLTTRQPVALLCEYLQMSPSTLSRLFSRHLKASPAQFHQRLRMAWAREQLRKPGVSVKEIAYTLGFHHPGDFSRAYRRHYHSPPRGD